MKILVTFYGFLFGAIFFILLCFAAPFIIEVLLDQFLPFGQLLLWAIASSYLFIALVGDTVSHRIEQPSQRARDDELSLGFFALLAAGIGFPYFLFLLLFASERVPLHLHVSAFNVIHFFVFVAAICISYSFFLGWYFLFHPHPAEKAVRGSTLGDASALARALKPPADDRKLPHPIISAILAWKAERLAKRMAVHRRRFEQEAHLAEQAIEMERARHRRNDAPHAAPVHPEKHEPASHEPEPPPDAIAEYLARTADDPDSRVRQRLKRYYEETRSYEEMIRRPKGTRHG